ncbi:MAG: hypothetical protein LBU53_11545 [Zoogloeaceae bacterium]|nr:hypothetical protein [Zoogloeaceae bacterium]
MTIESNTRWLRMAEASAADPARRPARASGTVQRHGSSQWGWTFAAVISPERKPATPTSSLPRPARAEWKARRVSDPPAP